MTKRNAIMLGAVLIVVFFYAMNMFIMSLVPEEEIAQTSQEIDEPVIIQPRSKAVSGDLTRQTFLDPSRKFYRNIIFADGKEVARFKSDGEEIFDVEGRIPDGKISFKDINNGGYGIEEFSKGKRDGRFREYLASGQLKVEKNYFYGRIVDLKEFYPSGKLRMTIDYSNALWLADEQEVGDGKIFFKDGTLMYEWHLTANDPNRYKKMYNYAGELVEVHQFDAQGKLIDQKRIEQGQDEG